MTERKKFLFVVIVSSIVAATVILIFHHTVSQQKRRAARIKAKREILFEPEMGAGTTAPQEPPAAETLLERLERESQESGKVTSSSQDIDLDEQMRSILEKIREQEDQTGQEEPLAARAFKVNKVKFEDSLSVTGDIKSAKEIKLRFEKEGVMQKINVKEGDRVKEGDIIASLYKKDFLLAVSRARSKLRADRAAFGAAGKELELTTILYNKGAIVETKLEEVKLRVESELAKVSVSEEELKMAESALEKTQLTAPMDGIIGAREAEVGEFFTPREIVVNLLGTEDLYAEVGVVERDIHKVAVGQKAWIKVDAYPGRVFKGAVGNLHPVVEGRSRMVKGEINIDIEDASLLPGMFAQVEILLAKFDAALMVPKMCLVQVAPEVYVLPLIELEKGVDEEAIKAGEGRGTVILQEVKIGYIGPDYVQVLAQVKEGDLIVLDPHGEVEFGRKVRILGIEEYGIH